MPTLKMGDENVESLTPTSTLVQQRRHIMVDDIDDAAFDRIPTKQKAAYDAAAHDAVVQRRRH